MRESSISTEPRTTVLFGASGQIGSALRKRLALSASVHAVAWQELERRLPEVLRRLAPQSAADFVFAGGVTDPKMPADQIRESNVDLPKRIVELTSDRTQDRYLTLGTVHERFPDLYRHNAYLGSKAELGAWMQAQGERTDGRGRFLHIRLHTIYGGVPKPHMFLGQMIRAIRANEEFRMSSGEQLREYHHADDIAVILASLLAKPWDFGSLLEITSGQPMRLGELAKSVFQAVGKAHLLKIGAISSASGEVTQDSFTRSPDWLMIAGRDPVRGVIDYVRSQL